VPRGPEPDVTALLEIFDDVTFERDGTAAEILQTKHHITGRGSLSDSSPDLWRTLRVWMDLIESGRIELGHVSFSLVTTGHAPEGSAAALLRAGPMRDPEAARRTLDRIATTSENADSARAYSAFLAPSGPTRLALLESITVLDGAPSIADVPRQLADELYWTTERRFLGPLIDRLRGWWHRRVLSHLVDSEGAHLSAESVRVTIGDLRDSFTSDNLPIDIGLHDADVWPLDPENRVFVEQLLLIALSNHAIEVAVRDYKRAYMQRSRWLRDELIGWEELERYEQALIDEWQHHRVLLEGLADASNQQRVEAGRALYSKLMLDTDLNIRARVQESFVPRGSFHMLADDLRVGWHPDFVERLRHLLEAAST
jgi:hypothetical protein